MSPVESAVVRRAEQGVNAFDDMEAQLSDVSRPSGTKYRKHTQRASCAPTG